MRPGLWWIWALAGVHDVIPLRPAAFGLSYVSRCRPPPTIRRLPGNHPVVARAFQLAASAQLRNVATLGGNVLQRFVFPRYLMDRM